MLNNVIWNMTGGSICSCKGPLHEQDCPQWDGTRCSKCNAPVFNGKYNPEIKFYCSEECANAE